MADGGDTYGDMVAAIEGVAEGWNETASVAVVLDAGLRVVGEKSIPFR